MTCQLGSSDSNLVDVHSAVLGMTLNIIKLWTWEKGFIFMRHLTGSTAPSIKYQLLWFIQWRLAEIFIVVCFYCKNTSCCAPCVMICYAWNPTNYYVWLGAPWLQHGRYIAHLQPYLVSSLSLRFDFESPCSAMPDKHYWTTPDQWDWLKEQLPAYLEAQKNSHLPIYWPTLYTLWFLK